MQIVNLPFQTLVGENNLIFEFKMAVRRNANWAIRTWTCVISILGHYWEVEYYGMQLVSILNDWDVIQ